MNEVGSCRVPGKHSRQDFKMVLTWTAHFLISSCVFLESRLINFLAPCNWKFRNLRSNDKYIKNCVAILAPIESFVACFLLNSLFFFTFKEFVYSSSNILVLKMQMFVFGWPRANFKRFLKVSIALALLNIFLLMTFVYVPQLITLSLVR